MKKHVHFRVLIVDDDPTVRKVLVSRLERRGYNVQTADSAEEALKINEDFQCEVLVSDLRMPGLSGFELIEKIPAPAIIITGHGDKESAIKAVEAGAFSFFEKPFDLDSISIAVQRAGEKHHLLDERERLLKRLNKLCKLQDREIESLKGSEAGETLLIGSSKGIKSIRQILAQLSKKPKAPLLIQGESGSGKEVVAKELHRLTFLESHDAPFLALNCATVPQDLLESELFGHEKGSFSGAHQQRIGLAEAVRSGTLLLDEIGDMAPEHQTKILRFLQERKFKRVGSNHEIAFKGRIIAASHKNLPTLVQEGHFREDLYYRLNIITVEIPPLRERKEDLAELANFLCEKHQLRGIDPKIDLRQYDWPGNVRELNNWIERASILDQVNDSSKVMSTLPSQLEGGAEYNDELSQIKSLHEKRQTLLDRHEKLWIIKALEENDGKVAPTARMLGIDRKNLSRRMQELGIDPGPIKKAA
ncbi:sigma-54-dependent Fis family transcriptional regulator [bacterium]|nr:sigma-54-dependent Fis family transcriptional regulator [bacterium]